MMLGGGIFLQEMLVCVQAALYGMCVCVCVRVCVCVCVCVFCGRRI